MAEELNSATAALRFAAATVVKDNRLRQVRRDKEFYYKLDRRRWHGFRGEFAAAKLLEKHGVPVVEHVWFGRIPEGALLVTRAVEDAPTVREFLRSRIPDAAFCRAFAKFIRDYLATGLGHNDLHTGNILRDTRHDRFVLVDVRGVRRRRFRRFPYDICRAPLELRRHLTKAELCAMLETIGVADPERFFDRALVIEAAALRRQWPKRRTQILTGYPKYTRYEGDVLVAADADAEELAQAEFLPGSEDDFCASFYWDIAEIPHRKALILDRAKGLVGYAREAEKTPLPEAELEQRKTIFAFTSFPREKK